MMLASRCIGRRYVEPSAPFLMLSPSREYANGEWNLRMAMEAGCMFAAKCSPEAARSRNSRVPGARRTAGWSGRPYWRAMIWTPAGRPCGVRPMGATVAGQIEAPGIARPEKLIRGRHLPAIDRYRPVMALALLVMREGGRGGGRAEHDVPVVEELVPQRGASGGAAHWP